MNAREEELPLVTIVDHDTPGLTSLEVFPELVAGLNRSLLKSAEHQGAVVC